MDELHKILLSCLVKGFFGEVTITINDGKITYIRKSETVKI